VLGTTQVGEGLSSDEGVLLGVASDRGRFGALRLGGAARLRSGTVLYQGARIGDRFQTGHNVVVREETVIGDDVSVWSNSVIDYGCLVRDGVKIHCNCYVAQFTEIEEGAFLGPGVVLTNDLYPGQEDSAAALSGPLIGAHAHIGGNVTVLPFVSIGAGALNVAVSGRGEGQYEGRAPQRWSAAFDGGIGVALVVRSRAALVTELHALVAAPHPVVRFADTRAATIGYPSLILTLALQVAP